jgi:hypothetical protein
MPHLGLLVITYTPHLHQQYANMYGVIITRSLFFLSLMKHSEPLLEYLVQASDVSLCFKCRNGVVPLDSPMVIHGHNQDLCTQHAQYTVILVISSLLWEE